MKLIIEGLSDYSKAHELKIEPVDLTSVLEKTLAILGYDIKKNNVYVIKNYPAQGFGKSVALADKNRLAQVFMNIIANAIQAMGEKGGDLSISIADKGNTVCTSITDSGAGIPKEILQKIFDPFFTTKESGTGLGLSITKKIVEEHRGSIYIDSRPGQGTTFAICLPAPIPSGTAPIPSEPAA
jgi:two-component system sporulation sensor kinase A